MSKYKNNYLTSVIARIDFALPPDNLDREIPDDLKEKIMGKFPVATDTVDVVRRNLQASKAKLEITGIERWKRWDFSSRNGTKYARVERDFFCIEYKKYQSFPALRRDFLYLAKIVLAAFPGAGIKRLGLRYVDQFDFSKSSRLQKEPIDWKGWLNPKLLAILDFPKAKDKQFISRALHTLELNYGEFALRFTYGIRNPDYPDVVREKQFILDTDAYCDAVLEPAEVSGKLNTLRSKIKEFFEASITLKMRNHLNANWK